MTGPGRFHGLLIIDKPAGWTSHDVVGRVRRLLGQRSVGHAGTLDPAATGVLPVAVGSALRAIEYLSEATKSYRAEITFGLATDTFDVDGRITRQCHPPNLSESEIGNLLGSFLGPSEQTPPIYSAIKVDGERLYERARRGESIDLLKRSVFIHRLGLVEWNPPVITVDLDCSKGFYVRSFARDLGERLGSCAHLSNLVRTRTGSFDLCDAWTLSELSDAPLEAEWERIAVAPDAAAFALPAVIIEPDRIKEWEQGKRWAVDSTVSSGAVRVYDSMGAWLGIGELIAVDTAVILCPRKVIPTSIPSHREED